MLLSSRTVPAARACRQAAPAARKAVVLRAAAPTKEAETKEKAGKEEQKKSKHDGPDVQPTPGQVGTLLNVLVNETAIAEMHLQMGSFELLVRRSTVGLESTASSVHVAAAPAEPAPAPFVDPTPPAMSTSTVDETLMFITSPKVGIFRRGKYAGNKKMGNGNQAEKGAQVKRGQAIAFIEQLGTFFPIEAPLAGEIAKFEVEDGAAVEYQEVLVALSPFFGGHIIGDSKHA